MFYHNFWKFQKEMKVLTMSSSIKQEFKKALEVLIDKHSLKQTEISTLTGISLEVIRNARAKKERGYKVTTADLEVINGLVNEYEGGGQGGGLTLAKANQENQILMDIINRQIEEGRLKDEMIKRLWEEIDKLKSEHGDDPQ